MVEHCVPRLTGCSPSPLGRAGAQLTSRADAGHSRFLRARGRPRRFLSLRFGVKRLATACSSAARRGGPHPFSDLPWSADSAPLFRGVLSSPSARATCQKRNQVLECGTLRRNRRGSKRGVVARARSGDADRRCPHGLSRTCLSFFPLGRHRLVLIVRADENHSGGRRLYLPNRYWAGTCAHISRTTSSVRRVTELLARLPEIRLSPTWRGCCRSSFTT